MERTITIDLKAAKQIRVWADAYVRARGLDADCTEIETIINQLVAAFNEPVPEEKPRIRVVAGSAKEAANG